MQIKTGDLWTYETDWLGIPVNCQVNAKGELIMGKGVAGEAKRRHMGLPAVWKRPSVNFSLWRGAGCECSSTHRMGLFRFPTKTHWRDDADLDLIANSARHLAGVAGPSRNQFTLPMPGVGLGHLDRADVLAVIEPILPDNVIVLELPA